MQLLWDVRVSLDLFLGGLGVGAFLMGAVLYYIDAKIYEAVVKKAFIIAPLLVMSGLLLLLSELGRPQNVLKTLYAINPTSFMSLGIFIQVGFLALSLFIAFGLLTKGASILCSKLVYIGAFLAALVGFYHGFLLTGIARDPWNNALPIIFFASSLVAGSSVVLFMNARNLETIATNVKIPVIFNIILTFELAAISAWVYSLALNSASSKQAYTALMSNFGMEFWGLSIIVGLILPIVLFTLAQMGKTRFKVVFAPASIAIVIGSFFLKNVVVYLGQMV